MNLIASLKDYVINSYAEAKKVTWPTKNQTINYSALVIVLSIGLAAFFSFLDYIFNGAITSLISQ